jgi:hypothetical protein
MMALPMTIPQALIALLVVLPIGFLGAWLRRVGMRAYQRDLTGWMALASGVLFGFAAMAFYWPPVSYLTINTAIILTLLSSLVAFLCLGALTLSRNAHVLLMGVLYCLLALPLIVATTYALFILMWAGAHLNY